MRAVFLNEGKVEVRDIEELSGDGIKVHVKSAGICGSDLHMRELKFPMECASGHEVAGVLDNGTPVVVEPLIPCGACDYCQTGNYHLCPMVGTLGITINGGMADEVIVPERCLVSLPSNVNVKDACLIEPVAVAIHGIRKANPDGNERAAVIGGGAIGLCAVAAAKPVCAEVGLAARYPHQIETGNRLGAKEIDGLYDIVLECAGTESAVNQAMDICKPAGKIVMLGTFWDGGIVFPQLAAMLREIQVINSYTYAEIDGKRDFDVAAELLAENPDLADTLITHRFPLEEAEQAFAVAADRKSGAIKVVLEP